ncbi:MAG TPA: hypothetical protein VH062_23800 [Polyangiaceae bacterium]|jgi:hypothetical protein|nr:hypothetical protein [Polyangiaceae bacterium]
MRLITFLGTAALIAAGGVSFIACSAASGGGGFAGAGGSGPFSGAGGASVGGTPVGNAGFVSTGSVTGAGGGVFGIGGQPQSRDDAGACTGDQAAAEKIQLDLYVMIDQSLSMTAPDASGMTRWAAVTGALQQFYQSPDSAGIGVGQQFFGLGLLGSSCTATDYQTPEVEIAPLPGNLMPLTSSLAMHGPSSVTPTPAALQGAILHAQDWKMKNPAHAVAVLLVTDGEPDLCGLVPDVVNAATAGAMGTPPVQTFVLGVGTSLDALNQVAMAGGSGQAYIVSGTTNVAGSVLDALNKIRAATALPCQFTLPAPDPSKPPFDYDKVNVVYTPQGAAQQVVYYTADPAACNPMQLAWHYDDINKPTRIELCPDTCNAISKGGGVIGYQLYCPVIPLPPR